MRNPFVIWAALSCVVPWNQVTPILNTGPWSPLSSLISHSVNVDGDDNDDDKKEGRRTRWKMCFRVYVLLRYCCVLLKPSKRVRGFCLFVLFCFHHCPALAVGQDAHLASSSFSWITGELQLQLLLISLSLPLTPLSFSFFFSVFDPYLWWASIHHSAEPWVHQANTSLVYSSTN